MAIEWNRVTKFSQLVAVILALIIFGVGFWLGELKGAKDAWSHSPSLLNGPTGPGPLLVNPAGPGRG